MHPIRAIKNLLRQLHSSAVAVPLGLNNLADLTNQRLQEIHAALENQSKQLQHASEQAQQGISNLADLTNQRLREVYAALDNQTQQLQNRSEQVPQGISNLAELTNQRLREVYAAVDNQTKQLQTGFLSVVAALERSSGNLTQSSGEKSTGPSEDEVRPNSPPDVSQPPAQPDLRNRLLDKIAEIGQQPFIQIACNDGKTIFLNLVTEESRVDFLNLLENSSAFARSLFLRALALSIRGDTFDASEAFSKWIELDDDDARLSIFDLDETAHSLPFRLQYPAYHLLLSSRQELASNFTSPPARARSLAQAVSLYDASDGNDFLRQQLIESASLALARYFSSSDRLKLASKHIELGLKHAPRSQHLRSAGRALNLNTTSAPVAARR